MGVHITNNTFKNMSTASVVALAILGYIVGIGIYYNIQQRPVIAKLIVTDTRWLGTISRAQHVALFMMLGYFFPNRVFLIMVLGAGWEVAEFIARNYFRNKWWGDGNDYIKDLAANALGFVIGYILNSRITSA